MPLPAYMTITNSRGVAVSHGASSTTSIGNRSQDSHNDEIMVFAARYRVSKPVDLQTGQVTGLRQHKPVTFTKYVDRCSPLLWEALCNGEQLQIEMKLWRTAMTGVQEHYYTIKWSECVLVDGAGVLPDVLLPDTRQYADMEEWQYTYKRVTWEHLSAGVSGSDAW